MNESLYLGGSENFCIEKEGYVFFVGVCDGGYYYEQLSKQDAINLRDWLTEKLEKMEDGE